jgi:hypothetical protein
MRRLLTVVVSAVIAMGLIPAAAQADTSAPLTFGAGELDWTWVAPETTGPCEMYYVAFEFTQLAVRGNGFQWYGHLNEPGPIQPYETHPSESCDLPGLIPNIHLAGVAYPESPNHGFATADCHGIPESHSAIFHLSCAMVIDRLGSFQLDFRATVVDSASVAVEGNGYGGTVQAVVASVAP